MRSFAPKIIQAFSWHHAKEVYIAGSLTFTLIVVLALVGYALNIKGMLILGSFNYLSVSLYFWFRNAGIEVVKAKLNRLGLQPKEGNDMMATITSKLMHLSGYDLVRTVRLTAVVVITAILSFSIDTPTHEIGIKLQHLVVLLGTTYALILPVLRVFLASFTDRVSPVDIILSTTAVVPGLVAVIWAIGEYADSAILILDREPVMAATYAAALALVLVIAKFTNLFFSSRSQHVAAATPAMGSTLGYALASQAGTSNDLTKRDIEYVAAHEAGHLITLAAFDELPDSFVVKIANTPGVFKGFVADVDTIDTLQDRNYWEWRMVKLLAGREAELFAFGTHTLGASSDHSKWLRIAKNYLGNHEQGLFYDPPSNAVELDRNEERLEALKSKQLMLLQTLLKQNHKTFDHLREVLAEKGTLSRDEATAVLRNVVLPHGFPVPKIDSSGSEAVPALP